MTPEYFYIALAPCGCCCASVVDDPGHLTQPAYVASVIADWRRRGWHVSRVPRSEWVSPTGCDCGRRQATLPGME